MLYIISIDPGSNLGIAIYGLNECTLEIVSIETILITLENRVNPEDSRDRVLNKLMVINDTCEWLWRKYNPVAIVEEAAFVSRFPKAVMQLSQYIATIELTFKRCNRNLVFFRYPPKYVKKEIQAGGGATKDDMTIGVSKVPEIVKFINPGVLSEHEVDALAIGYVGIQEIRDFPYVLYA